MKIRRLVALLLLLAATLAAGCSTVFRWGNAYLPPRGPGSNPWTGNDPPTMTASGHNKTPFPYDPDPQ